jgi:hypothetical protein
MIDQVDPRVDAQLEKSFRDPITAVSRIRGQCPRVDPFLFFDAPQLGDDVLQKHSDLAHVRRENDNDKQQAGRPIQNDQQLAPEETRDQDLLPQLFAFDSLSGVQLVGEGLVAVADPGQGG